MGPVLHAMALAALVVCAVVAIAVVITAVDDFLHRDRKDKQ